MKFFFNRVASNIEAGLSIHGKLLRYVEINEIHERIREFTVNLDEGCVVNSTIKNFTLLENAFIKLRDVISGFHAPVVIGLPAGEVTIKPLPMPDMPIDDIKSSLSLNFDEHFTVPENDSVFDATVISTPPESRHKANTVTVLTAASRKSRVDKVLAAARKAGMTVRAIEPSNFALLRAITEDSEGLCIFVDPKNIITTWEGHGIFFRTSENVNGFNEIRSTMQFVESQYRGVRVSKIILARVNFQLASSSEIQVVNIQDEYYASEGLALRESAELVLDLRPAEYIALEKRRNSMNLSRVVLTLLASAFLLLSMGTIIFTFVRMSFIQSAIDISQELVTELSIKRDSLIKDNARLQAVRARTEKYIDFLIDDMPVLEVMNSIEVNAGTGIKIEDTSFARSGQILTVSVNGTAADEKSLIALSEGLKMTGMFLNVITPTTAKNENAEEVKFNLTLTLRSENNDDKKNES